MFHFFMKRRFVNDVLMVMNVCHQETARPSLVDGFSLSKPAYIDRMSEWCLDEAKRLNAIKYAGIVTTGDAIHSAKVWVGVFMVTVTYRNGAFDVPKPLIKKFYAPANEVAGDYFEHLRTHAELPFGKATQTMGQHIDRYLV